MEYQDTTALRPGSKRRTEGMTLTEMVMAMALLAVFFAVLMPQFRILHRSWGLREASALALQNGRVLLDHMQCHLAAAREIAAAGDSDEPLGFLEFRDANGNTLRYEVGADNWVCFGPAGSLSPLAGPVSRFQIAGFAADDLDTPATDPATMRLLRVEAAFPDAQGIAREQTLSASVFLRTERVTP